MWNFEAKYSPTSKYKLSPLVVVSEYGGKALNTKIAKVATLRKRRHRTGRGRKGRIPLGYKSS